MMQAPEGTDTLTKALLGLISVLVTGMLGLLGVVAKALVESRKAAAAPPPPAEPSPWQQERLDVLGRLTRQEREVDVIRPKLHNHDSKISSCLIRIDGIDEDMRYLRQRVDEIHDR